MPVTKADTIVLEEIIEQYNNLLNIILSQIKAVQRRQWDELETLTDQKLECLESLVKREESLASSDKQSIHDKVLETVQKIVKEDARLNTLLQATKQDLGAEIKSLSGTKKNVGKISGLYGKKFSNGSAFNERC